MQFHKVPKSKVHLSLIRTYHSEILWSNIIRMTLLLGAPGSGKTTFLKALAGKLDSSLKVDCVIYFPLKPLTNKKTLVNQNCVFLDVTSLNSSKERSYTMEKK